MKYTHRIFIPLLLILLAFILSTASCGFLKGVKGSISGTVYIDGRPQAFGTIQVFKLDDAGNSTYVAQDRCTETGHYIIQGLDAGTYSVTYLNARGNPIGGNTTVEVRLGRFEPLDLNLTVQGIPSTAP
ncbi:MAG: hypothetical protein NTY09_06445 [bacterium]|nr:hypothetical protein [bacterium]